MSSDGAKITDAVAVEIIETPKLSPEFVCARCGFRTYEEVVANKHSTECKVPLNRYGG